MTISRRRLPRPAQNWHHPPEIEEPYTGSHSARHVPVRAGEPQGEESQEQTLRGVYPEAIEGLRVTDGVPDGASAYYSYIAFKRR